VEIVEARKADVQAAREGRLPAGIGSGAASGGGIETSHLAGLDNPDAPARLVEYAADPGRQVKPTTEFSEEKGPRTYASIFGWALTRGRLVMTTVLVVAIGLVVWPRPTAPRSRPRRSSSRMTR